MIKESLSELAAAIGARLHGSDGIFEGVSTDSRTLWPGCLFVALRGDRVDGHDCVAEAVAGGAVAVVVERRVNAPCPQLVVPDTRRALGAIGRSWCRQVAPTVVAVTGSNGKTTVKQMLAAILSRVGPTLATAGNFNNEIGVPLTLCRLPMGCRFAVIEMGASRIGDIRYLADLATPDVGIVTNARPAHLDGFGSLDGVAQGKGEMFDALSPQGVAIINADDTYQSAWRARAGNRQIIDFAIDADAAVTGEQRRLPGAISLHCDAGSVELTLPVPGRHALANALAATAACRALGISLEAIAAGLEAFQPPPGRLDRKRGLAGSQLLDDTYNANPASLQAAAEVLCSLPGEAWVAIGEMAELGEAAADLHEQAGVMLRQIGVRRLYAVGSHRHRVVDGFGPGARAMDCRDDLIAALQQDLTAGVNLLIKGSRSAGMDKVATALLEPSSTSGG